MRPPGTSSVRESWLVVLGLGSLGGPPSSRDSNSNITSNGTITSNSNSNSNINSDSNSNISSISNSDSDSDIDSDSDSDSDRNSNININININLGSPIPPPGWQTRRGWKKGMVCKGPLGLALQSARTYALTLTVDHSTGITIRQRGEVELRYRCEPPKTVRPRILRMLGRARMRVAQLARPSLHGAALGDRYLAAEIMRRIPRGDRGIWRTITSGQFMTAYHAKKCGIIKDDACCFCGIEQQTAQHLWFTCPATQAARKNFGVMKGRTPRARDLRRLCQQCLRDPSFLPPITASYGVPVELGASLTTGGRKRREARAAGRETLPGRGSLRRAPTSGGWPRSRAPPPGRLGPTSSAEDLRGRGTAPWEPNCFTAGRLEHCQPWAPLMALGNFAIWAPGRTEEEAPRTEQE